jgi:nucleotide-binding universal stress UspA family protein
MRYTVLVWIPLIEREALMYRTILLAYDGTREGRLALREGAMLAKIFRSEVVLLAVVEPTFMPLAFDAGVTYLPSDQKADHQKVLDEGSERLTKLGLTHKTVLQTGDPATCIANVAKETHAELVVVGHRKSGRLARWLHEPLTASLIETLNCSVLSGKMEITDEALYGQSSSASS